MATKPEPTAAELTAALVTAYGLAEQQILSGSTRILKQTALTTEGAFTALGQLRQLIRRILDRLTGTNAAATAMVSAATGEGRREAERQVSSAVTRIPGGIRAGGGSGGRPPGDSVAAAGDGFFDLSLSHGERAAQAIRDDVVSELEDVRRRITRLPDDIYKFIAPHGAIYQVLDNDVTPAQAQAMAWRVFVSQGVTGFTDRSGRDWSLSAYVEMAVRTASTRAFNASHLARMQALGVEYFTIPVTAHTCPKCFPWQGKVITAVEIENPAVPVAGTIADAVAAGLWHPNCKHPLTAFYPGYTVLPDVGEWTAEDQRLYELSQKQRRLELEVRKAKRQLEYAATPEAAADAARNVRRAQAKVREFVKVTGFARQSRREQIDLSDPTIKMPDLGGGSPPPQPPNPPRPGDDAPDEGPRVQMPPASTPVGAAARRVVDQIARVHRVPGSTSVRIDTLVVNLPIRGGYLNGRILIDGKRDRLDLTIAHELGHWLDHQTFGEGRLYGSDRLASEAWKAWNAAVQSSTTVEGIRSALARARTDPEKYSAAITQLEYLLDPHELFARSYAQWLTVRSDDGRFATQLAEILAEPDPSQRAYQWDAAEFETIAASLDRIFSERGLR